MHVASQNSVRVRATAWLLIVASSVGALAQEQRLPFAAERATAAADDSSEVLFFGAQPYGAPSGTRMSLSGWRTFRASKERTRSSSRAGIGPLDLTFGVGTVVEFNDNVNLSETNPISDIVVTPQVNFAVDWQATRSNRIRFGLGVEYSYYFGNPELNRNGLSIAPGTTLGLDFYIGDFVITVYDQPAVYSVPSAGSGITDVTDYFMLSNTVGVSVLWDLNKLISLVGFEQTNQLSLNTEFSSQDYSAQSVFAGTFYTVTPTITVGLQGLASRLTYTEGVLNDYDLYQGGVVLNWQVTKLTAIFAEVGLQHFEFFDTGTPLGEGESPFVREDGSVVDIRGTAGGGNFTGPYFRLGVFSQLNRYISHQFEFQQQSQGSSIANFTEEFILRYGLSWEVNRLTRLYATFGYQRGTFSGENTGSFNQFRASIGVSRQVARNLSLFTNYAITSQEGDFNAPSYHQNVLYLGFNLNF